tara:strand:+ start:2924 stop:4363 length:1440 start_codon:yes stop_codon:yes gene_type:complete
MAKSSIDERVKRLEAHLQQENPVLAGAVKSFRRLDRVARRLGVMGVDDSYAVQVSWWPVISLLGTFSSGKSTFINQLIGDSLQRTGNQAVDDKFTVICYGTTQEGSTVLPGLSLDSDPRFPFYRISRNIEEAARGEGRRVDSYLQLKTFRAESIRGKIFIDSPGFDADQQRSSTLLITDHIMDLSDLVLVFFDARHPEPGAMRDTLEHLVANTINRPDSTKFLYILNQIDNTAREDNPEEVVAAWQRALAQNGLTAGRFYRLFAREAAVAIEDEQVRERLERKRDEDLADIETRIRQVEVERAYRVVGVLEKTAKYLRDDIVPQVAEARKLWRRRTFWLNSVVFGALVALFLGASSAMGLWQGLEFTPLVGADWPVFLSVLAVLLALVLLISRRLRWYCGRSVLRTLAKRDMQERDRELVTDAFAHNLKAWWRASISARPRGWTGRSRRQLESVLADADKFVQSLNDRYASPSGDGKSR